MVSSNTDQPVADADVDAEVLSTGFNSSSQTTGWHKVAQSAGYYDAATGMWEILANNTPNRVDFWNYDHGLWEKQPASVMPDTPENRKVLRTLYRMSGLGRPK
jgi:hypothetical protein